MFSFLKRVIASLPKGSHRRPSARGIPRRSLNLESLEARQLLSASPLVMAVSPYAPVAQTQTLVDPTYTTITPANPIASLVSSDVVFGTPINASLAPDPAVSLVSNALAFETPITLSYAPDAGASGIIHRDSPPWLIVVDDFQNVSFHMNSEDGSNHQLTIQAQNYSPGGNATFTGVWDGPNSGGAVVSGSLTRHGSNTAIKFTWGDDIFTGTISGAPGAYHIEGTVYSYGVDAAPGFTVGDQVGVPDLTGMKWKMPSGGHNFSLRIATQTNLADGTATFTGTWNDKQAVTGTLRYEADGSISISFAWEKHQFEGTLPSDPTYYDIDGTVYSSVDGNPDGPGHLHGMRVR